MICIVFHVNLVRQFVAIIVDYPATQQLEIIQNYNPRLVVKYYRKLKIV